MSGRVRLGEIQTGALPHVKVSSFVLCWSVEFAERVRQSVDRSAKLAPKWSTATPDRYALAVEASHPISGHLRFSS